jgi:hypothetical protein
MLGVLTVKRTATNRDITRHLEHEARNFTQQNDQFINVMKELAGKPMTQNDQKRPKMT